MHHASSKSTGDLVLYTFVGLLLVLTGCSDPYEQELSASGFVTTGQAEKLAIDLEEPDKDLFKRWAARAATADRFPGENVPLNVRLAIMNQTRYEAVKAEEKTKLDANKAKEDAKHAEEQRIAEADRQEQEATIKQLKETDAVIKDYFVAKPVSYDIVPVFNSFGGLAYREWQFDLRLVNSTPKEIIGVSGLVLVKDAFGEELGMYEVRMEPSVPPRKAIDFTVAMRHDPRDAGHGAMLNTKTIFFEWLFYSVAFRDGTAIDKNTIAQATTSDQEETKTNMAL